MSRLHRKQLDALLWVCPRGGKKNKKEEGKKKNGARPRPGWLFLLLCSAAPTSGLSAESQVFSGLNGHYHYTNQKLQKEPDGWEPPRLVA